MLSSVALAATLEIAVLTMTPGADLFARFGHTAVRVSDGARARVYNYGTYDARDPELVSKFVHNRLDYWVSATSWEVFQRHYAARDITVQTLDLSDDEAARVAAYLEWNLRAENRTYRYDWFRNNCSTKVRDVIDEASGNALKRTIGTRPGKRTFRAALRHVLAPLPSVFFLMDIGLNRRVDEPLSRFDELAMPGDLMEALREVERAPGRKLVRGETMIPAHQPKPNGEPIPIAQALFVGVLALLGFARWRPRVGGVAVVLYGALSGVLGLWFFTWWFLPYPDTFLTANALLWGPPGILVFTRGRWARRVIITSMIAGGVEMLFHLTGHARQPHYWFTAYALIAGALVLGILRQRERMLGGLGKAATEHAAEVRDEARANLGDGDGAA